MSFRFSLPASDARLHREEEVTVARMAAASTQHQQQRGQTHNNARQGSPLDALGAAPPSGSASAPTAVEAGGGAKGIEKQVSIESARSVARNSAGTARRRVVFPDPIAFRYLEEDPSASVIERRAVLRGYELYLVEQWACSRRSPTLVIATYTGDVKHSIVVGVMAIPADEAEWTLRLRVYFGALQQHHARPKETHLGRLMVTNLSSFPSALTVIPVPDGDIRRHRQVFIVNEDLKRLGCSGRSGMTLSDPTPATQAKFLQLYKTSDRIPLFASVLELVKLCQAALFVFGMLEQEYVDGLLCDMTETAIGNWWTEIGSAYFNIEPSDGILGPTTVAALLGTLMGARNRLSSYGSPVGKDVFDMDSTKRGIGYFQKSCKLERTRRLDRQTLLKLHSVTAKAAAGEGGWGVQKAVKSTVAEIGGKRGEMVIGMVSGGRDKANIGDIETLDMDRFISLAYGERAKWLWHGKAKRSTVEHPERHPPLDMGSSSMFGGREDSAAGDGGGAAGSGSSSSHINNINNNITSNNAGVGSSGGGGGTGGPSSSGNRRVQTMPFKSHDEPQPPQPPPSLHQLRTREDSATISSTHSAPVNMPLSAPVLLHHSAEGGAGAAGDRADAQLRKTVFKRVGGKVSDARSGLGRTIRDAVGGATRRAGGGGSGGHASRGSKDEGVGGDGGGGGTGAPGYTSPSIASLAQSATSLSSPVMVGRAFTWKNKPEEYTNGFRAGESAPPPLPGSASPRRQHGGSSDMKAATRLGGGVGGSPRAGSRLTGEEPQDLDGAALMAAGTTTTTTAASTAPPSVEAALLANSGSPPSAAGGSVGGESADLQAQMLAAFGLDDSRPRPVSWLVRRRSIGSGYACTGTGAEERPLNEAALPRRLSFSLAEEAVLRWEEIVDVFEEDAGAQAEAWAEAGADSAALSSSPQPWTFPGAAGGDSVGDGGGHEDHLGEEYHHYYHHEGGGRAGDLDDDDGHDDGDRKKPTPGPAITLAPGRAAVEAARGLLARMDELRATLEPWAERRVLAVERLDDSLARQQEELRLAYDALRAGYESARRRSAELLAEDRALAAEALREVEVLVQRLDYEATALASKVADVEDGVAEFGRQVAAVERRAGELKVQLETESWVHWAVRTVTGIGTGPNITRGPTGGRWVVGAGDGVGDGVRGGGDVAAAGRSAR